MSSTKRADLQGIRGLAIFAVLLFHFFPKLFPNGYIGVDQFFVLSGFLISMILSRADVSLNGMYMFYYRRIKRILPMYLLIISLILLSVFTLFPPTSLDTNISSACYSLLLATNLVEPTEDNRYAVALSIAQDNFTHTWSLAVEMQFYLLVPLIYLLPNKHSTWKVLLVAAFCSFAYHILSDENTAFNSVFARFWQFCIGGLAHSLCVFMKKDESSAKYLPLDNGCHGGIEAKTSEEADETPIIYRLLTNILILPTIVLSLCPVPINSMILRILTTVITAGLIVLGDQVSSALLSLRPLTYLGDISYSLYLVHWPIYTYTKMETFGSLSGLSVGLVSSMLLACLLAESFEKCYLMLSGPSIALLLILLYSVNFTLIYNYKYLSTISNSFKAAEEIEQYFNLDATAIVDNKYDGISADQALMLNKLWISMDLPSLNHKNCIPRETTTLQHECEFNNTRNVSGDSIVIMGNSYSANLAGILNEECAGKAATMRLLWKPLCEVFIDTTWNGTKDCVNVTSLYLHVLEKVQPDVLYIIVRHMDLLAPLTHSNISKDPMVTEGRKRLIMLEKEVKKRIYILDAFPRPNFAGIPTLIDGLKRGELPEVNNLMSDADYIAARRRIAAIVEECQKCKVIDIMPAFTKNGRFQMYDRRHGLLYFSTGAHLTPLGKEKVRGLFRKTCF